MPPGSLPLPPWEGTVRPIFIVHFVLRFLEVMQGGTALSWSQVDALSALCRNPQNSSGSTNCHDKHQFLFYGNLIVTFACNSTQLDHRLSEELVTDKSIVNVFVLFLATPLLKLFCRVELFATFFLPVSMTVWPALPDVEVRDSEEIQHGQDILLVFCCTISQKVSTRAIDDANVPIRQACSTLWFRLHVDYLA